MNRSRTLWLCGAAAGASAAAMVSAQPVDSGAYLDFDGVDDAAVSYADFGTQELTVEVWARVDSTDPEWSTGLVVWGSRNQGSYDFCVGTPDERRLCFFINYNNGQRTLRGNAQLEFGRWYFLAATYDGEAARLYIDGVLDAEGVLGDPIKQTDEPARLSIGEDYPGMSEMFGGAMDEVKIWSEARSAEQIYDDMLGDGPERGETLMAHYSFDEFRSNLIIDHSGNGRHAHLGLTYDRSSEDPTSVLWGQRGLRRRYLRVSSNLPGEVEPVGGGLQTQLHCLNGCLTGASWSPIVNRHEDFHQRGQFPCDGSLDGPYVDTETFLTGVDEITRHNCESAFYKFDFYLPPLFEHPAIFGIVNADDMGVVFLNGEAISPLITMEDVDNFGLDRVEAGGHRLVGWPTTDPVYSLEGGMFLPGKNELILAVASDISEFEPAGTEFITIVRYDCLADWNADGAGNTLDFIDYLNDWNDDAPEADVNADGRIDTRDVRDWLNAWAFGCPE